MNNKPHAIKAKMLAHLSLLVAMEIILNRFLSINTWSLKIGFSFLPVVIAAMLYGPLWGGVTWAVADFLGAILFPIGTYFPGFTLTAFLAGMTYGLFLHKRPVSLWKILAAVLLVLGVLHLGLNSVWISVLYGKGLWVIIPGRVVQQLVMLPVQTACIWALAAEKSPVGRAIMKAAA